MDLEPINLPAAKAVAARVAPPAARFETSQPFVASLPATFHGSRQAGTANEIITEKPHHRQAAYLIAGGYSAKEVAQVLDVTPASVYEWLKVSWFQSMVTTLMAEQGGKDIVQLFKSEQFNSFAVLVELRDDPKVSPTVRFGVAKEILDRTLGKTLQRIESSSTPQSDNPVAEAKRLEDENNRLRNQTL